MSHAPRFCIPEVLFAFLLLCTSTSAQALSSRPVFTPSPSKDSLRLVLPDGHLRPVFLPSLRTAYHAPTSSTISCAPTGYLNDRQEDIFSGHESNADSMSHTPRFCIPQALLAFLLLCTSAQALSSRPVLPPPPSKDSLRPYHPGRFFRRHLQRIPSGWCFHDHLRPVFLPSLRTAYHAPTSSTMSCAPTGYLNDRQQDIFSGHESNADSMSHTPRFCIPQALLAFLLLCTSAQALSSRPVLPPPPSKDSLRLVLPGGHLWPVFLPSLRTAYHAPTSSTMSCAPTGYLNDRQQDIFRGHESNADSMSHTPRFCIPQALLAFLLLCT
ncbi:hypothetical protein V5799_005759 [Amblyomma americanum]|uniref:Secreted protein n=1 Tax=Amblyomma americanum TaxID=6943 RepID=A0AAQ4DYB8_AMBAM